jgi:hypothetical protein
VHVLDLAFALPIAVAAGVGYLRRRGLGELAAPVMLTFFAVTSIPIALTPVVSALRSHDAEWLPVAPVSVIAVLCVAALWQSLKSNGTDLSEGSGGDD